MPASSIEISEVLTCYHCGYDLRASATGGVCPECGTSIADSRERAAVPRRPRWAQSDPRWRRRLLAGVWVLVLLPLMDALLAFEWTATMTVPTPFAIETPVRFDRTFATSIGIGVFPSLMFCIGAVLLFANERGRRPSRLDWTRRWGILCSYAVFLLLFVKMLFVIALVLAGLSALFNSIPPKYQPAFTATMADVSVACLHYGPHPGIGVDVVLTIVSSAIIALACVPLFEALRSSGPKWLSAILLVPLVLFAAMRVWDVGERWLGLSAVADPELYLSRLYFRPHLLVWGLPSTTPWGGEPVATAEPVLGGGSEVVRRVHRRDLADHCTDRDVATTQASA